MFIYHNVGEAGLYQTGQHTLCHPNEPVMLCYINFLEKEKPCTQKKRSYALVPLLSTASLCLGNHAHEQRYTPDLHIFIQRNPPIIFQSRIFITTSRLLFLIKDTGTRNPSYYFRCIPTFHVLVHSPGSFLKEHFSLSHLSRWKCSISYVDNRGR